MDGLVLCRLALHHDVAPTALTAALQVTSWPSSIVAEVWFDEILQRPPARRIPTVLQILQTSRLLPPGLIDSDDLVDGRLDKLCCMTALLCLFQALRPTITLEMVEKVEVAADPALTTKSSPARHLPDLPSNLPPASWTNVLEEVESLQVILILKSASLVQFLEEYNAELAHNNKIANLQQTVSARTFPFP